MENIILGLSAITGLISLVIFTGMINFDWAGKYAPYARWSLIATIAEMDIYFIIVGQFKILSVFAIVVIIFSKIIGYSQN